jgi:hypothetical protein
LIGVLVGAFALTNFVITSRIGTEAVLRTQMKLEKSRRKVESTSRGQSERPVQIGHVTKA